MSEIRTHSRNEMQESDQAFFPCIDSGAGESINPIIEFSFQNQQAKLIFKTNEAKAKNITLARSSNFSASLLLSVRKKEVDSIVAGANIPFLFFYLAHRSPCQEWAKVWWCRKRKKTSLFAWSDRIYGIKREEKKGLSPEIFHARVRENFPRGIQRWGMGANDNNNKIVSRASAQSLHKMKITQETKTEHGFFQGREMKKDRVWFQPIALQ